MGFMKTLATKAALGGLTVDERRLVDRLKQAPRPPDPSEDPLAFLTEYENPEFRDEPQARPKTAGP